MTGTIVKVEEATTTIATEKNEFITIKTPFLPLNLTTGDKVEIEDNKIVIR